MRFSDEPVVGWRQWCIDWRTEEPVLRSVMTRRVDWPARERMTAYCKRSTRPPCEHNDNVHHCGIHAFKDHEPGRENAMSWLWFNNVRVAGRVSLWGRVVEHELGWRAQYAYPFEIFIGCKADGELYDRTWARALARRLQRAYAVDAIIVDAPPTLPPLMMGPRLIPTLPEGKEFAYFIGGSAHGRPLPPPERMPTNGILEVLKMPSSSTLPADTELPTLIETETYIRGLAAVRGVRVHAWFLQGTGMFDPATALLMTAGKKDFR